MARAITERFPARAAQGTEPDARRSSSLARLVTVTLTALLLGAALLTSAHQADIGRPAAAIEPAPASVIATTTAGDPAAVTTASAIGVIRSVRSAFAERVQSAGTLLPQASPGTRTLTRLGDARFLSVVLAGFVLAIVGRRPATRRPLLLPIPVSAAPGLGVRRRGPPPR